jgi:hypothetical protein
MLSDARLLSQSRLVALASTVPLALTGALSLYVATRGRGQGEWLPWAIALASALVLIAVRAQQRHEGQVFVEDGGLRVRTVLGKSVHVGWREIAGARVGVTALGLPSRYAGALRLRLRSAHPIVGRTVTTILASREEALAASAEIAREVERALEGAESTRDAGTRHEAGALRTAGQGADHDAH